MSDAETGAGREAPLVYYWNVLRRRRMTVLGFTAALFVLVLIGSLTATRYYAASAVVEISPKAPMVLDVDNVSEVVPTLVGNQLTHYYETQYRILESRTVLAEAIRRLREEHGVKDFDDVTNPVGFLRAHLTIEPEAETHLVGIRVEYPDPELAALFANVLAASYMDLNLDRTLAASRQALEWLGEQQEVYRREKFRSDERVHAFRAERDLLGPSADSNITFETLEQMQAAWSEAHTRRVRAQSLYDEMQRLLAQEDGWRALGARLSRDNAVLADMIGRLNVLEQERSRLRSRYREAWPAVVQVNEEIDGLRDQIRDQVHAVVQGQRAELELVLAEERAIERELRRLDETVERLGEDLIQLKFLTAEAERNELFFRHLDQRMTEVGLSQFMQANNVRFVDEAEPPAGPVRPQVLLNLLTSVMVGLLGGATLAVLLEYIDPTVRSREDAEAASGVPLLGLVPLADRQTLEQLATGVDRSILVHALPRSTIAECLRTIRTNLMFRSGRRPLRRLLVTSAVPREGKSFISTNLSSLIAMAGSRVLLIDGDLRRPTVHQRFELDNERGLADVLLGRLGLEEAIQTSQVDGLTVLAAGPCPSNPSELMGSGRMEALLDTLEGYDLVVIDSPPVDVLADGLVLASMVDGVVYVIESGRTSRNVITRCCQRLREVNPELLGTVVNKLDIRSAGSEYNYYYRHYDEYYGDPTSGRSASPG